MARIENKKTKVKNATKTTLLWIGVGVCVAVAITLIVILIVWLVTKDKKEEDKTFPETYTNAEFITCEELADLLDNDTSSSFNAYTVFVYVYSPDYDTFEMGGREDVQAAVNAAITAYADYSSEGDIAEYAFYVLNVTTEENKEYLSSNTSFFTDYSLSSTYPYVLKITNTTSGIAIDETYSTKGEIVNALANAANFVTGDEE